MKQAAIYFFGLLALVFCLFLLYTIFGDAVPIPVANLVSYTAIVFWFVLMGSKWLGAGYSLYNKTVQRMIPRLLAIHAAFLVLVFAMQATAFALKSHLRDEWLVDRGRNPSWFVSGLMLAFVSIATVQVYLFRGILSRRLEADSHGQHHYDVMS